MTTKKKIKELITSFLVSDGESKTEKNSGSSETPGENIGEKWDTSESLLEITNLVLKTQELGLPPELGPKETSLAMKMVPIVLLRENMLTPLSMKLLNCDYVISFL